MTIRCLLADDNPENLTFLKALCGKAPGISVLATFMSGSDFLENHEAFEYDACFLDIDMPGLDGMSLAKIIGDKKVIFVSAHKERAWEAYDVEAVDFIPKPVQIQRFLSAVDKLKVSLALSSCKEESHNWRILRTSQGQFRVHSSKILAVYSGTSQKMDARDKICHLEDGQTRILKNYSMKEFLDCCPQGKFIQINRSAVINVDCSYTLPEKDSLIIEIPHESDKIELIIGQSFREYFFQKMG